MGWLRRYFFLGKKNRLSSSPTTSYTPSLNFSDPRNSMYLGGLV